MFSSDSATASTVALMILDPVPTSTTKVSNVGDFRTGAVKSVDSLTFIAIKKKKESFEKMVSRAHYFQVKAVALQSIN